MLGFIVFIGLVGLVLGIFCGYLLACIFMGREADEQFLRGWQQGVADGSRLTFGYQRQKEYAS